MRSLALALMLLAATGASAAQLTAEQRAALRHACAADIHKLCAGIRPGGGRLAQCVQEKSAQFSLERDAEKCVRFSGDIPL